MIGLQLPFFWLLVPFWLLWAFSGRKAVMEIWPAVLVTGLSFAIPQFLVSNYIAPKLVDIIAAIVSMVCLVLFLRVWQRKKYGRRWRLKAKTLACLVGGLVTLQACVWPFTMMVVL